MKDIQVLAPEAVVRLLRGVPNIKILYGASLQETRNHHTYDERIDFRHADRRYALIIEVNSNGAPRFARDAALQLNGHLAHLNRAANKGHPRFIPMFVTSYLSPEARDICKDHNVAYLDLFDNAHLKFDDVFIDWASPDRPKSETRVLRSIFTPKAAAILRVMLREGNLERAWKVSELAKEADASLGHVSNVRKALLDREWIEKTDDGVVLTQPDALLKTWREIYRRPVGLSLFGYTHLHGKPLEDLLSRLLGKHQPGARAICAMQSAAQWFAPFGRGGGLTIYADEAGSQKMKRALGLSPVEKGSNVTLCTLEDETLFEDAFEPVPGIFCTNPITTYLDLWKGNDRDREAAEFLASEFFPWL